MVLIAAWQLGALGRLWRIYRSVPLFNEGNKDEFWFYHAWYSLLYPTLWPLTGFLALVALVAAPRPASLALCVFTVRLPPQLVRCPEEPALHRLRPALPLVLWGIGLAALWSQLRRFLASLGGRARSDSAAAVGRQVAAI